MFVLGARFPRIASLRPSAAAWELDFANPADVARVAALATTLVAVAGRAGFDHMDRVATEVLADFIAAAGDADDPAVSLLRLLVSEALLDLACAARRFDDAWRWATLACFEGGDLRGEVNIDLAIPFRGAAFDMDLGTRPLVRWAGHVCYMAWSGGYLKLEATEVAPRVADIAVYVLDGRPDEELVESVAHIGAWLHVTHGLAAPTVVAALETAFERTDASPAIRRAAGAALATGIADLTAVPRADRARTVLEAYTDGMHPTMRLQLVAIALGDDTELVDGIDELLAAIAEHVGTLQAAGAQRVDVLLAQGRMWHVVLTPVAALLTAGRPDLAFQLIARWFDVSEDAVRRPDVLAAIRQRHAVQWIAGGAVREGRSDAARLTSALNQALGTTLVDAHDPIGAPQRPDRPGIPLLELSEAFRTTLGDELCLPAAREALDASAAPARGLLNLVSERAPIAWLLQESCAASLPLVVSMQEPAPDRAVRHVEIWFGDLAGAEDEASIVASIFEAAGVEVATFRSAEHGVGRFVERYDSSAADVLWVISHGEFGHYDFRETRLQLATGEALPLDLFAQLRPPAGDRRRLLVLNSCDGATAAGLGGPSFIGIGALAAESRQAVVSHAWPVGFNEAIVFGALLAVGLSGGQGFFEAYASAIDTLLGGSERVRDALSAHPQARAARRFLRADNDCYFLRFASPRFLE